MILLGACSKQVMTLYEILPTRLFYQNLIFILKIVLLTIILFGINFLVVLLVYIIQFKLLLSCWFTLFNLIY